MSERTTQDLKSCDSNGSLNTTTKVFFTPPLDCDIQRRAILERVHQCLAEGNENVSCEVIYLGQVEWESVGQVSSLTCHVMSLCRKFHLLPSARSILLSLHDQYQAIQLCLARTNKKKHGEFMAAASDVLDVWNDMFRNSLISNPETITEENEEVIHLPSLYRESYDPVAREMEEIIKDYHEFMVNSNCLDHFIIYSYLQKNLKHKQELLKDIFSKAYVVEGVSQMPAMERELLKLLLNGSQIFKLSSEFPIALNSVISTNLDISGIFENDAVSSVLESNEFKVNNIENHSFDDISKVEVRIINSALNDYVDSLCKSPCKVHVGSDSEFYIEQLILAHLRLLINTRDELALTLMCCMPGRGVSQQGFTDIRLEAQKKSMPMYQTILSFIMRQRLGGKGYQADPNNPVLLHIKPLGEVVDSIMKLQNIVEEEPDLRKGALQVMSVIKTNLLQMKERVFKRASVEKVWSGLNSALISLLERVSDGREPAHNIHTTCSLQPCLKHLIRLCDEASGHIHDEGIVDALGENFLSQYNSGHKFTTPVRIPTVISLFRSPAEVENIVKDVTDSGEKDSLRMRLLKKTSLGAAPNSLPERYHSGCAWAPDTLSPISKDDVCPVSTSPIIGRTLKAVGARSKNSQHWRDIVASVSQAEDRGKERIGQMSEVTSCHNEKKKKKCSRSLLSDISSAATESAFKKQKSKDTTKHKSVTKRKINLPKGQKLISSFFKV